MADAKDRQSEGAQIAGARAGSGQRTTRIDPEPEPRKPRPPHASKDKPEDDELLRDMRRRVEALGAHAAVMKTELPQAYGDGFGRIVEGLSLLVEKLGEPEKTATSAATTAEADDAAPITYAKNDTADPSLDDAWDTAAADVLARIYESGDAGLMQHVDERDQQRARLSTLLPGPPIAEEGDRRWLERRFAEVTTSVQQLLGGQRPGGGVTTLEQRVGLLEARTVSRSDAPTALGRHETDARIELISRHLEGVQEQTDRLSAIEGQLADLKGRLSDEQIVRLLSAIMPTDQELAQLAEIAAEKVVKRVVLGGAAGAALYAEATGSSTQAGPGDLEPLLRQFISERGRNDQDIGEALSCFQDAMEHVLDRIDAIEAAQASASLQAAPRTAPQRAENGVGIGDSAVAHDAAVACDPVEQALAAVDAIRAEGSGSDLHGSRIEGPELYEAGRARPQALGMIRPRYFLAASLAAFLLAGFWLVSGSRLLPASDSSIHKAEADTPVKETSIASESAHAPTAAPAGDGNAPKLRTGEPTDPGSGNHGPQVPAEQNFRASQPVPETRAQATPDKPDAQIGAQTNRSELQTSGPAVSGPVGITVQQSDTAPSPEEIMRWRQRQRMASLSTRLGQEAAATSSPVQTIGGAAPASGGGDASPKRALELPPAMIGPTSLRLAAAQGDASAQLAVAVRFAEGKGVKQDFQQAALWYQRAASQGLAAAQYRLATLYERGLGVQADPGRARLWYQRAAEQGNVKAMHNLAVLHAGREGTNTDYAASAKWFAEAAEKGLADSQYNLGVLYESGLGVARDAAVAYKWYALAALAGDKEAVRRRDLMRSKLDGATVKALDAQVADWKARPADPEINDAQAAGDVWRNRSAAN